MISNIPIDSMHLLYLGVMKKLLLIWYEGKRPHKLSPRELTSISRNIIAYKYCIPRNFNRKCRPLNKLKFWKATELRLFLLYLGPFVLHKVLDSKRFNHFMLLHTSVYILATEGSSHEWIQFAKQMLDTFVSQLRSVYYKEMLVYNFHTLLHISDEVLRHGCLESFSAFRFENFMQTLKGLINSNSNQLVQVARRLSEGDSANLCQSSRTYIPTNSDKNLFFLTDSGDICHIKRWEPPILAAFFKKKEDIRFYPFSSSKLGIYKVSDFSEERSILKSSLRKQCIFLKDSDSVSGYIIPLCHIDS
jgi:hypothetical protein